MPTDSLGAAVVIAIVFTIAQRLIGLVRAVMTCSWLDAEQLGRWDMAFGFLTLATPLAMLSLPGVFGRYVEHYRPRGQLKPFVRRVILAVTALAALSTALLMGVRPWVSHLLFGEEEVSALVGWLVAALLTTIGFSTLVELLTGLRVQRYSSVIVFVQSSAFAVLSAALVVLWGGRAESLVAAYVVATAASLGLATFVVLRIWRRLPESTPAVPLHGMWARILPFAVWLWLTDAIENLFSMVDRYLILHIATLEPSDALAQIGQYHSARLVSVVLLNVAALLGALLTPYVSRDWESGQADHVEVRLGLTLKLTGLALVAVAAGALALAPPFFATFFQGRFDGGLVAMPWVLAGCVWMGMAFVARTHLWCAEKPRLWFFAVTAGLMTNVGLAFALLPRYGLVGAAASTAIAQLVTFAIILGTSRATGVRFGEGTWMVVALPAVILLGPWASGAAVLAVTVLVLTTDWFLQPAEKRAALSLVGKRRRRCTTPSGI